MYLVELRLLEVVPLELGVEVVERLDADVVEVADLGELRRVGAQRRRGRQQHLEVFLQVRRDQLQVRLSQRLQLEWVMNFRILI